MPQHGPASNPHGLSEQDLQDLQQIRSALPPGDPRVGKIDTLLADRATDASLTAAGAPGFVGTGTATIKAAPEPGSAEWWRENFFNMADAVTKAFPAAGATIGAYIGTLGGAAGGTLAAPGPGTAGGGAAGLIGGAGIGGMAGEAAKQISRRAIGLEAPQTPLEAGQDIALEGLLQGGIEAGTAGLGKLVGPLKGMSVAQFRRALRPTTLENKAIAEEIAPELLKRRVRGSTESIEKRAASEIARLRPGLTAAHAGLPLGPTAARSPVTQTLKALDNLKGKYVVDGRVMNQKAFDAIEGVQEVIEQHGNNISPQSMRKVKQIFDEAVSEAGGFTTSDLTTNYTLKAQKEAANTFRRILHDAHPNVAALDREMSFWLDVQQVAKATNVRQLGQQGGLTRTVALPLALAGSAGLGIGGQQEASAGTAAVAVAAVILRSPRWRTSSAVFKNQLANALARNDLRMATALAARLGITTQELAAESQASQTAPQ